MFFFCGISLSNTTPQRIKASWCTQWWASIKSLWIFVSVNHITPALFFLSAVYFLSDLWLAIYSVNVFVLTYWNLFVNLTFVNSHSIGKIWKFSSRLIILLLILTKKAEKQLILKPQYSWVNTMPGVKNDKGVIFLLYAVFLFPFMCSVIAVNQFQSHISNIIPWKRLDKSGKRFLHAYLHIVLKNGLKSTSRELH